MRHKGVSKEETRQKMREATGQGFRENGFAGIGIDALAKQAGVTSGAFYTHFGSKAAAFEAALADGLDEVIEAIPEFQVKYSDDWVRAFAEYYLSKKHRKDLACGCAMASLTTEVVRSDPAVHAIYEKKMTRIAELIAKGLPGGSAAARRNRAWALLGMLIGGINVARAMKGGKASDEVAEAIVAAVVGMV